MRFLAKQIFCSVLYIRGIAVVFFLTLPMLFANVYAHHSHANLDRTKVIVNKGTVVKYGWSMQVCLCTESRTITPEETLTV